MPFELEDSAIRSVILSAGRINHISDLHNTGHPPDPMMGMRSLSILNSMLSVL